MSSQSFINRELSWLEFNQRVLNEALRNDLPLLDRVKFLAITASNLDEFFQVRVGGLTTMRHSAPRAVDLAGLTPKQQLTAIHKRTRQFVSDQYALLNDELLPQLAEEGLGIISLSRLSGHQLTSLQSYFESSILPLLSPFILGGEGPLVTIPHLELCIAAKIRCSENEDDRFIFIPIPPHLGRRIPIDDADTKGFVLIEELVAYFCGQLFPDERIVATCPFRVTRNGDIAVQEDDGHDFADEMEEVLVAREFANSVRLQIPSDAPASLTNQLAQVTGLEKDFIYPVPGPIGLSDFMGMAFLPNRDHLRSSDWHPQPAPDLDPTSKIVDHLRERDLLLIHPFQSFDPVVRLIEEAASDPDTLAIKQVLYRTAKNSRIIDALILAAEAGKQVTVLVELKARFDEARNLSRAEELQRAGVQVVYGVKGLKTHAKITLIVRNEDGHLGRYVHLGTGNYNESTAKLYTDISYLTSRADYAADASLFFNAVTGRSKLVRFQQLIPAPTHMKRTLLDLIAGETARAKEGTEALIMVKVNSLQDKVIIEALYKAADAGVKVKINVRGICCLQTDHPNIHAVSIIDRYLEHPRVFSFHQGGDPVVYISSADWMTRNLDKRVELMTPIADKAAKHRLLRMLEDCFRDNTQASVILADGSSKRLSPLEGEPPFRLQEHLQKQAAEAAIAGEAERAASFEPHLPQ